MKTFGVLLAASAAFLLSGCLGAGSPSPEQVAQNCRNALAILDVADKNLRAILAVAGADPQEIAIAELAFDGAVAAVQISCGTAAPAR